MNNEIKEILDYLKPKYDIVDEFGNDYKKVKFKDCKILLNFITNLQKKINRIDKLINTDYGWVSYYYKCNNRYLKSKIKEDINNILKGDDK